MNNVFIQIFCGLVM